MDLIPLADSEKVWVAALSRRGVQTEAGLGVTALYLLLDSHVVLVTAPGRVSGVFTVRAYPLGSGPGEQPATDHPYCSPEPCRALNL